MVHWSSRFFASGSEGGGGLEKGVLPQLVGEWFLGLAGCC